MEYMSVKQAAEKWGVSVRRVQSFIKDHRIEGVERFDHHAWMIPTNAKKPGDPRISYKENEPMSLSTDLCHMIDRTIVSMPMENPDAILEDFSEDRFRLHLESELAYLRGDYESVIRCFDRTAGDDAARLRACPLAIAAAISMGKYDLYTQIEGYLRNMIQADICVEATMIAELALNTAYVSAIAPNMASDWIKTGDFQSFPDKVKPDAAYKRAKYFQGLKKFEAMLVTAQTALSFCDTKRGILYIDIYLRIACALACCAMDRIQEATDYLVGALQISLPHGFITPFAESASAFGGLLEKCIKDQFPEYTFDIAGRWKRTFTNWMDFHNHFTKDNITQMLSLRNYQIASLVVRKVPYVEIAKKFHISEGRLKNIISEIYGELFISGRKELSELVL